MPFTTTKNWKALAPTILKMGEEGMSRPEIAKHFGVSTQRIHQVIRKRCPEWRRADLDLPRRMEELAIYERKWGNKSGTELYQIQRQKLRAKKANAMRVGYTFTVQYGDLVWPTHCPVLGLELDYFAESRQENSPSFDRFDTDRGYEPGNVHIVSWRANRIKNDGTAEEHEKIAEYIRNTMVTIDNKG